ncbi:MAG: BCCT family transporter [Brachybacterium sp.]|nr:BCCT family transporter [Brachybacterium sp.]
MSERASAPSVDTDRPVIAKRVFWPAATIVTLAVALALIVPQGFNAVISTANDAVVDGLGWYFVLLVTTFVVFSLAVAISRFGKIRLGNDNEKPQYGLMSWFSMLFAAGMGIGLVFWGAAEPLSFFEGESVPPNAVGLDPEARAQRALGQTFLHWGLHAWAIYVVVGLAVAYSTHRKGRPISIRWALEPILGKRTNTWIGDLVDIIAIVGTLCGVAMSLGYGVNQIFAGLVHIGLFPADMEWLKVLMVVVITAAATLSVASGVDKGIRWLSNINLVMAAVLLLAVLALGPTLFILRDSVSNVGYYLQNFIQLSFQTLPFFGEEGAAWTNAWTVGYWGWWISWAPFVGVFIARISRGRTVREFIIGVLLVPTLVTIIWFTVMGGTAIYESLINDVDFTRDGAIDPNYALFDTLSTLPATTLLSGLAIVLVTIFFITSADSGAFVVDMIAHGGNTQPPRITRIFWASGSGAIAAALIWASLADEAAEDGMAGLQALALLSAGPFTLVMIAMMISVWQELRREVRVIEELELQIRQREFVEKYSGAISDQVADQVVDDVHDRVVGTLTQTGELRVVSPDTDQTPGPPAKG